MTRSTNNSSRKKKKNNKDQFEHSHVTKKKLIAFFNQTAELERKLEIIKEMLGEEEQFTPTSLFYRFDCARKGYIVEKDIQDFLIDNKIHYKGSQLKILFGRLDTKLLGRIGQREFQNFILPNQNSRLRYFIIRRSIILPQPYKQLNEKIEWIIGKFFIEIMTQYSRLRQYSNELISSFDFNIDKIFSLISSNQCTISGQDIDFFMKENGSKISAEEIGCIVKLIDKKGEGRLYKDDFKVYFATLGLKKQHEIFDQLSPIPALKETHASEIKAMNKNRNATLKQRYKDNKSYVKGMDDEGHHILGYSRIIDDPPQPIWLQKSRYI